MSTATQIKYNEKGQNNIYPDDTAASFVDGALKSNSTELPFTQVVDLSLIDDPDFIYEDGNLKPVNQYGNAELVCVWTQNNQANFSTIAQPFENNNVTVINGFASMVNGDTNLSPDFIVGTQKFTAEFDLLRITSNLGVELFRASEFSNQYIIFSYKTNQSGDDTFELTTQGNVGVKRTYVHVVSSGIDLQDENNISITYVAKQGSQNGKLYLSLNGAVVINQTIDYEIDTNIFNRLKFKTQNAYRFKNFRFENADKYQGANFTPIETLSSKPFKESRVNVISKQFSRNINQISSFDFNGSTNVRLTAQDKRFANTSQTWVDSTMTYAQSTIMSIASQNISTLEMNTPDVKINLHFPESNTQEFVSSFSLDLEMNYLHPVVNLTTTGMSIFATECLDFEYKAFDEEGCFIFVWLIADGEWWYYNLTSSAWELSDRSFAQSNTLAVQAAHISKFEFNNTIKKLDHSLTLYLPIDPVTGFQSLESPSVEWIAYEYGQHNVELPPPHETTLMGMARDVGTNVSVDPIRVSRAKSMIYPSTIVRPDQWDITPDPAVGSFSKGLYETETIKECYKFEQSYRVTNSRTGVEKVRYDLIGFSVLPKIDKIRLDDLPFGSTENEAKINYAIWLAAGKPQPIPNDLFSQCEFTEVSGDCLIEYVNSLGGGAVAGMYRGVVSTSVQMRSTIALDDGDYVQNLETTSVWQYDAGAGDWSDTQKEIATAELELLVEAIAERAVAERTFRGVVKDYTALTQLPNIIDTDYAHVSDTQTVWQYDVNTSDWIDTGKIFELGANKVDQIPFENVDIVVASYATYIHRPIVQVWILEDNNTSYTEVNADVDYDTVNKQITVNFNGSFETGFLFLS